MKILIIGGVAGGANVAARARRLSETAEIIIFERGPYVSFANCGLPYHIGGEIADRKKLFVHTPESLKDRFNIDVRIKSEVTKIDPARKVIRVRELETGREYDESFTQLVVSTGASPIRPPIPGIDRPGLFTLRDVPDMDVIQSWLSAHSVESAAVIGGGFIGIEMAEQLRRRGLSVTVFERNSHILPPFDLEMAAQLHEELKRNDVALRLHATVTAFEAPRATERAAASVVVTEGGERFPADVILFGIGVRPEVRLALDAGIVVGPRGGIRVDDTMRTSHPDIWALGDCVETTNVVTGTSGVLPLAGPANRQGRLVAENIIRKAGTPTRYRGTLGTAVVRVFEYVAACTGANERTLQSEAIDYEAVHVHASSHASYYPGAYPVSLKLLFDRKNGRVLGAQAVGKEGVDKRIDVIATAIAGKMTVDDLTHLELCYAPPIGSAKDVVNMAGMAASNIVHGIVRFAHWRDLAARREASMILDVRDESEWEKGHIPGAVHIPLNQLRTRLSELPNGREIIAYCHSGQRSYNACRILMAHGFDCRNLSGAYKTWSAATAEV